MANPVTLGIELVQKAVEHDSAGNYTEAVRLYELSLDYFQKALVAERNDQTRALIQQKYQEYASRAETLKRQFGIGEPKKPETGILFPSVPNAAPPASAIAPLPLGAVPPSGVSLGPTSSPNPVMPAPVQVLPTATSPVLNRPVASPQPNALRQSSPLQRALDLAEQAQQEDRARNYPSALQLYQQSLELFMQVYRGESNPTTKKHLSETINSYMERAEKIKQYLDAAAYSTPVPVSSTPTTPLSGISPSPMPLPSNVGVAFPTPGAGMIMPGSAPPGGTSQLSYTTPLTSTPSNLLHTATAPVSTQTVSFAPPMPVPGDPSMTAAYDIVYENKRHLQILDKVVRKNLKTFLPFGGPLMMEATLFNPENHEYHSGETLNFKLRVENNSNKTVNFIKFSLKRRDTTATIGKDAQRVVKTHIEKIDKKSTTANGAFPLPPGGVYEGMLTYTLPMEGLPRSESSATAMFSREYELIVHCAVSLAKNLTVSFSLNIVG